MLHDFQGQQRSRQLLRRTHFGRKLIECAINQGELAEARSRFNQMSELERHTPSTIYLIYKVALRESDESFGI